MMKVHNPETVWPVPPQYQEIYSHAVETQDRAARQLHLSGQVGVAPDGSVPATFEAQCAIAMANVEALLAQASMTMAHVYRLTYYLVRRDDLPALTTARQQRWKGFRPAVTTLLVAGLVRPEFLVEIDVSAQRGGGER